VLKHCYLVGKASQVCVMDIPSIHCCNMLNAENETLKRRYKKLTKMYKLLEKNFIELKETLIQEKVKAVHIPIAVERTEISSGDYVESEALQRKQVMHRPKRIDEQTKQRKPPHKKVTITAVENKNNSKLLALHNDLVKKYEKEIKVNRNRAEQITKLALEKNGLKQELVTRDAEICELKKQLDSKERIYKAQGSTASLSTKVSDLRKKLLAVDAEKTQLEYENEKLKDELKGLDKDFFDEVEDLKYALHKSASLNVEYERVLKSLCDKFDVDYSSLIVNKRRNLGKGVKKSKLIEKQTQKS